MMLAERAKGNFANPTEFPLQNVYDLKLSTVEVKTPHGLDVGVPETFRLLGYNGLPCAPTIRVRRGSKLRIHLKNDLQGGETGTGDVSPTNLPSSTAEKPHDLATTNLHTHGLHVNPADPGDNIRLCMAGGKDHDFTFEIPDDHPSGTFWYHPHHHGSVAYQLSNGVAGALIVEGTSHDGISDLDDIPEIAAAAERIFVLQLYNFRARRTPGSPDPGTVGAKAVGWVDATTIYNVGIDHSRVIDIKVPAVDEDPDPTKTVTFQATALNGQINPTIVMAPGEVQRWRLIHAGWDLNRQLIIVDQADKPSNDFGLLEMALDGLATGRLEKKEMVEIAPGQRSDILIKAPDLPSGVLERVYHLKQLVADGITSPHGTSQDALFLAKIVVKGSARSMPLPDPRAVAKCRPLPDVRDSEISGRRPFKFKADDDQPALYTINDATFPNQTSVPLAIKTAEEWTLTAAQSNHPFHIHVNPFQVVSYTNPTGKIERRDDWRDTLYIKENETYVIRTRFRDFPGQSVFHCHILDHEDQGMMMPLTFSDGAKPLPPQVICQEMPTRAAPLQASNTPAPSLKLADLRGEVRDLKSFRGRSVALVFFQGLQCSHCGERLADLVREARDRLGRDTAIIAVSARKILDPAGALRLLGGPTGSESLTLLTDESHAAFRAFGCYDGDGPRHGLFLVDPAGLIRERYVGDSPFADNKLVVDRIRVLNAKAISPMK